MSKIKQVTIIILILSQNKGPSTISLENKFKTFKPKNFTE